MWSSITIILQEQAFQCHKTLLRSHWTSWSQFPYARECHVSGLLFLCSFISREFSAFLSFTFCKWQNPTHPSKPAEMPCPLKSTLRTFLTGVSGRHFGLLLFQYTVLACPTFSFICSISGMNQRAKVMTSLLGWGLFGRQGLFTFCILSA